MQSQMLILLCRRPSPAYRHPRGPAFDLPIPITEIVSVTGTVTASGFCFLLSLPGGITRHIFGARLQRAEGSHRMRGILEHDCRTNKRPKYFPTCPTTSFWIWIPLARARLRCMTVFFSSQPQHERGRKPVSPLSFENSRPCFSPPKTRILFFLLVRFLVHYFLIFVFVFHSLPYIVGYLFAHDFAG